MTCWEKAAPIPPTLSLITTIPLCVSRRMTPSPHQSEVSLEPFSTLSVETWWTRYQRYSDFKAAKPNQSRRSYVVETVSTFLFFFPYLMKRKMDVYWFSFVVSINEGERSVAVTSLCYFGCFTIFFLFPVFLDLVLCFSFFFFARPGGRRFRKLWQMKDWTAAAREMFDGETLPGTFFFSNVTILLCTEKSHRIELTFFFVRFF